MQKEKKKGGKEDKSSGKRPDVVEIPSHEESCPGLVIEESAEDTMDQTTGTELDEQSVGASANANVISMEIEVRESVDERDKEE